MQESDIDADSILSRFRFLVPIMLGACHVMACVLWYVGTYNLPPIWREAQYQRDADTDMLMAYNATVSNHWLGYYSGWPISKLRCKGQAWGSCTLYHDLQCFHSPVYVGNVTPQHCKG